MHRSRGRNSSFGFLMILGASEWPEGAGEVDLYPGGSIWKGFDQPRKVIFFFQNFGRRVVFSGGE